MYKGRAPASKLVLQRGGLTSEIALQEFKIVYRGVGADFENRLISGKIRSGSQNPVPSHSVTVVPVTLLILQSGQSQSLQSNCHSRSSHTVTVFILLFLR